MTWRRYLPSAQFSLLAAALIGSVALVYAADFVTKKSAPSELAVSTTEDSQGAAEDVNWKQALDEVQANGGATLPKPPDQESVNAMIKAAETKNVTASVGRTLLVQLAAAKAQGMGSDIPTQDSLVAQAISMVPKPQTKVYTAADITFAPDTKEGTHAYGNLLMATLNAHPGASMQQTLVVIANAADSGSSVNLKKLLPIEKEYRALLRDLVTIPVPKTMSPLHVQIVNDIAQISDTFPNIEAMIDDPVRGLTGIKRYQSLTSETKRVFINISQSFNKDGILFLSGEPGESWASVLSAQ